MTAVSSVGFLAYLRLRVENIKKRLKEAFDLAEEAKQANRCNNIAPYIRDMK